MENTNVLAAKPTETKEKIYCFENDPGVMKLGTEQAILHPSFTELAEYLRLVKVARDYIRVRPNLTRLLEMIHSAPEAGFVADGRIEIDELINPLSETQR